MKRSLFIGALFMLLPGVVAAQGAKNAAPGWSKDYAAARATAKASDKPMFLVFR